LFTINSLNFLKITDSASLSRIIWSGGRCRYHGPCLGFIKSSMVQYWGCNTLLLGSLWGL